jgi:ribose-phosphate pyrophosphokinase
MARKKFLIFSGNSNKPLTTEICNYLGMKEGKAKVKTFSDKEIQIEIDENVRQREVYVIQSTCDPVNNNLTELLLMIDALKRSSARRITAVIPYFGYGRQDKKVAPRVPISAKLMADLIQVAGAHKVITMELHAAQIQGFFNIPVDNLFALGIFADYFREKFKGKKLVIVSPDAGGTERARALSKKLDADLAIINKRRETPNKSQAMELIGNVRGRIAIILDDMVDTAGTIVGGVDLLLDKKAKAVYGACTHPVLSGPAVERIINSKIVEFVVNNTIPVKEDLLLSGKAIVLPVGWLFGEAIARDFRGKSVTSLFR